MPKLVVPVLALTLTALVGAEQDRGATLSVSRQIAPGASHTHQVASAIGGMLFSGTIEWRGSCASDSTGPAACTTATVEVLDAARTVVKTFFVWKAKAQESPSAMRVGFATHAPGTYTIRISAASTSTPGSYVLTLLGQSPAERLRNTHVHPREDFKSDRITRLIRELSAGTAAAEELFWSELAQRGTPFIEPSAREDRAVLATFVWRAQHETQNVLLNWPPAASRADDYFMSHIPGTQVWYKTVLAWPGTRVPYTLSPNDRSEDREFTDQRDPLNPRKAYDENSLSLFELPGAPDERWVQQTPTDRGKLEPIQIASTKLVQPLDGWVYTPAHFDPAAGPYPLLILFNGYMYVQGVDAPRILDNLIEQKRIRRSVVCFIQQMNMQVANTSLLDQLATVLASEFVPHLRKRYGIATDPRHVIVGGFSAGAAIAAYVALRQPNLAGNVLAQSGAFRSRAEDRHPVLAAYADTSHQPVRFYIDTGLYEPFAVADRPVHEVALEESNTIGNRHFRDVLRAKGYDVTYTETAGAHDALHTRSVLPTALMALLPLQ